MDENPVTRLAQIGLTALKNAILINGAACIALFTLLGHAATSEKTKIPLTSFGLPLIIFASGVFAAALASGTAYFAEGFTIFERDQPSRIWGWITIGLVSLSLLLFVVGVCATYNAIVNTVEVIYR